MTEEDSDVDPETRRSCSKIPHWDHDIFIPGYPGLEGVILARVEIVPTVSSNGVRLILSER